MAEGLRTLTPTGPHNVRSASGFISNLASFGSIPWPFPQGLTLYERLYIVVDGSASPFGANSPRFMGGKWRKRIRERYKGFQ